MKHLLNSAGTGARRRNGLVLAAAAVVATGVATAGVLADRASEPAAPRTSIAVPVADSVGAGAAGPAGPAVAAAHAPAPVASSAPAEKPAAPAAARTAQRAAKKAGAPPAPPASKSIDHQFQTQINYYYCGPAATRIALTALGERPTQDELAANLGTTTSGTNSAADVTRVLNGVADTSHYTSRFIPGGSATPAQIARFQADVVRAINTGYPVVANIAGSVTDTAGAWHSYPGGHYLTVVGYRDKGRAVRIADPAIVGDGSSYWLSTIDMANWMATRGYSH